MKAKRIQRSTVSRCKLFQLSYCRSGHCSINYLLNKCGIDHVSQFTIPFEFRWAVCFHSRQRVQVTRRVMTESLKEFRPVPGSFAEGGNAACGRPLFQLLP